MARVGISHLPKTCHALQTRQVALISGLGAHLPGGRLRHRALHRPAPGHDGVRKQSEIATGDKTFDELLSHYRTSPDPAMNDLVNRVGGRLAAAANRPEYHWEFLVLENDPEANAFCVPGGKVAIFTGIFEVHPG